MTEPTSIPATLAAISAYSGQLEADLQTLPLDIRTTVVLALHELLVNIALHGYAGAGGVIEIAVERTDAAIQVTIVDYAPVSFTLPESVAPPDLLDLPEHGMGLFIIYQTFDDVHHEHCAPGNRWQLTRKLN